MIFGRFPLDRAEGVVLAHSLRLPGGIVKKGRALSAADIAALRAGGVAQVVGARLEPGDVAEDPAAAAAAAALCGPGLAVTAAKTGRCNLVAEAAGLVAVDAAAIHRLNAIDESLTVATVPDCQPVVAGQTVATVKVIPFAVAERVLDAWRALPARPPLALAPLRACDAALIQTTLPGTRDAVLDATAAVTRGRLEALGSRLAEDVRVPHTAEAVAAALERVRGRSLVLISGASATADRNDEVPAGIVRAGGAIAHFGMPVDPGNLLLLAWIGQTPVVDMPGCGRSPKPNGLDLVLARLLAGLPVGRAEIMAMGVGGLLKDIASRPLPRDRAVAPEQMPAPPRVAALVLAAGASRRMGAANKLLAEVAGKPLVAHAVDAALASNADPVLVVVGHEAEAIRQALAGRAVQFVDNPEHAEGMAASVRHGIAALPPEIAGAVVCLGDMPAVSPAHIDALIAAFAPAAGRHVCVSTHGGRRGNPVLLGRAVFGELAGLTGDIGARRIIAADPRRVTEVAMPDAGVLLDVDTPDALRRLAPGPDAPGTDAPGKDAP